MYREGVKYENIPVEYTDDTVISDLNRDYSSDVETLKGVAVDSNNSVPSISSLPSLTTDHGSWDSLNSDNSTFEYY